MPVRAKVRLTIELTVNDAWDEHCTVAQLRRQAKEAVVGALRAGLVIDWLENPQSCDCCACSKRRMDGTVIGEPTVTALISEGSE